MPQRPLILPRRQFVYPAQADEVERGALEVLVRPAQGEPFLATCALGYRDSATPTGVWSMPDPDWLCAVSGGYTYLIHVPEPERFVFLRYRPVLAVRNLCLDDAQSPTGAGQSTTESKQCASGGLTLFVGHHSILAWGREGEAWESDRLSWEGVTVDRIEDGVLYGQGWDLMTDKDLPFALDLKTGKKSGKGFSTAIIQH